MEITNRSLIQFMNHFHILDNLTGFDFTIELNENYDLIAKAVKILAKIQDPDKAIEEYKKQAGLIYVKYAERDSAGDPKTEVIGQGEDAVSKYVMDISKEAEFSTEIKALNEKHKKDLELHKQKTQEYLKALDAPARVKINPIRRSIIPESLTNAQMRLLFSVGLVKSK